MPLPGQASQEACGLRVGFTSLHYIWYYNGGTIQDVEMGGEKARMGNVVWENPLRRMEQAVDKVSRDYTRQIRWHKKHLRTVSAKLTVPEYEQACTEYICDYYANMGVIADPVNGGGL